MNYLLVKPEELDVQGYDYKYAERIPDGRVILQLSALKVLSNFSPEVLSKDKLKALIKEQKESGLYDSPEEENASGSENRETVKILMRANLQERIPLLKNRPRPKILLNRKGVTYES